MDDTEKYQPPSLASLSMRVVILSNLDERQLVHPLEKRVNAIRSLLAGGRYRIKGIVLEIKRLDGSEPTDRDWAWGRKEKPHVTIGSDVKLSFIQHSFRKKEFQVKTSASSFYPWYRNFFSRVDHDSSMHLGNKHELFFVQESFYESSIQTTEWEKIVSKKNFAKVHQKIPWKFRKESFTIKGNDLFWRIQHKSEKLMSSWICVSRRYVNQNTFVWETQTRKNKTNQKKTFCIWEK